MHSVMAQFQNRMISHYILFIYEYIYARESYLAIVYVKIKACREQEVVGGKLLVVVEQVS